MCSRKHFISASRLSLLSPCRALLSSPPFFIHLHFLIKTILCSFGAEELVLDTSEVRWQHPKPWGSARSLGGICTRALSSTQICFVSTVHNPFRYLPLASPRRAEPHLPVRESGAGHLLCIHYTPPPASTNQEPEQGGRLGKHIVTTADLYIRLSAAGDRDAERAGWCSAGGL